jgi:tripartite-type tricarboxylate transporter receptor subunit TctC
MEYVYETLSFNFIRDIAPLASIVRAAGVLVVLASFPARTAPELISYAKVNPGKITIGSAGTGSTSHLFWELFRTMIGVDMQHVPYRGEGPALTTDLLGGQVQVMIPTVPQPSNSSGREGCARSP